VKELVVISGKGGTGKTSIVASLAVLAEPVVTVDCDVDAADLHLLLTPEIEHRESFYGGSKAEIRADRCIGCGQCKSLCRFGAIGRSAPVNGSKWSTFEVQPLSCEGCGVCAYFCQEKAIDFSPVVSGQWFLSKTRCGPMVHAELGVGAENSGKMVTEIRTAAKQLARKRSLDLLISDGSPGIGCPVIASLTGCSLALFVVEPTVSGLHDFRRIANLARKLGVPGVLAVNKADLNESMTCELQQTAFDMNIPTIGRIPYDPDITRAQREAKSVVEISCGQAAVAIGNLWLQVKKHLAKCDSAISEGIL